MHDSRSPSIKGHTPSIKAAKRGQVPFSVTSQTLIHLLLKDTHLGFKDTHLPVLFLLSDRYSAH